MKQQILELGSSSKRTRKREFLGEMERVVLWPDLVGLITPYMPEGQRGRPPFPVEAMLRIHFMQPSFTLSDPAMEEALHDVPLFREFAGLGGWDDRLPDESTILRFRHLLEEHELAPQILKTINELLQARGLLLRAGTVVDATLIAAPSSTKNVDGQRDPEMHQTRKGKQWYFGMKLHIGVDNQSGPAHSAVVTAAVELWQGSLPGAAEERDAGIPRPGTGQHLPPPAALDGTGASMKVAIGPRSPKTRPNGPREGLLGNLSARNRPVIRPSAGFDGTCSAKPNAWRLS